MYAQMNCVGFLILCVMILVLGTHTFAGCTPNAILNILACVIFLYVCERKLKNMIVSAV